MWLRALPLAVGRNPEPFLRARPLHLCRQRSRRGSGASARWPAGRCGCPLRPVRATPLSGRATLTQGSAPRPLLVFCSSPSPPRFAARASTAPSPSRKIARTLMQDRRGGSGAFPLLHHEGETEEDGPCSMRSMVVSNAQNAATGWTSFHRSGGPAMTGGRCVTAATAQSTSSYARRSSPSPPSPTTRRDPERRR
jgi:hypothetical protein